MAKARRRLYTSVAALVRRLRKPSEAIWHWAEYTPGEVDINLIVGRRKQTRDEMFWGASGRSLHFRKVNGRWTLVGRGCWRT